MNERYIKLYSKIIHSDIFHDEKALKVFIWILCTVDYKTGKMRFGRFNASTILDINPNSLYHVISRLSKKYKIINIKTNNKFSEVSVLNWAKYQMDIPRRTGGRTSKEHQKNTNQEVIEIKERDSKSLKSYLLNISIEDLQEFSSKFNATESQIQLKGQELYDWVESKGKEKTIKDYKATLRTALRKDYGAKKEGYTESGYKIIT